MIKIVSIGVAMIATVFFASFIYEAIVTTYARVQNECHSGNDAFLGVAAAVGVGMFTIAAILVFLLIIAMTVLGSRQIWNLIKGT